MSIDWLRKLFSFLAPVVGKAVADAVSKKMHTATTTTTTTTTDPRRDV